MPAPTTSPLRRTGLAALVGVLAVLGTALSACSDDDASSDDVTTTAAPTDAAERIAERFNTQTGLDVDDAAATCMGDALVADLGDERAVEVFESNEELPELPEDEQTAIRTAFNDCVPAGALAEPVAIDFYVSMGAVAEPDAATLDCLATELDGHAGDAMWATFASDRAADSVTVTMAAFETCLPTSVRVELFTGAFAQQGVPEEQTTCLATAMAEELTMSELVEIGSSGMSPEIESRIAAASAGCA